VAAVIRAFAAFSTDAGMSYGAAAVAAPMVRNNASYKAQEWILVVIGIAL